jgi:hypothetical protein
MHSQFPAYICIMKEIKVEQRSLSTAGVASSTEQPDSENRMEPLKSASDLSPGERGLLQIIHTVAFGHIEAMTVIGGQPDLSSMTVVYHCKLDQAIMDRPAETGRDFLLKREFIRLFETIRRLGNATVRRLEIRHGLPAVIEFVTETGRAVS